MTNETVKTSGTVRTLLWVVLAISLAGNAVLSTAGVLPASIALGVVALASGIALGVLHYRSR
jgi:hypothetical protein